MKYALLLYADETVQPDYTTAEGAAEMQQWFEFSQELGAAGAMLGGEALEGVATATTVQVREGSTITADGPFAETKEALGGFYLLDVDDLDAAIKWAEKIPNVGYGTVEIRPLMVFDEE
ncbi:MAG: YciI family protein [Actinomycetota bacterium]